MGKLKCRLPAILIVIAKGCGKGMCVPIAIGSDWFAAQRRGVFVKDAQN